VTDKRARKGDLSSGRVRVTAAVVLAALVAGCSAGRDTDAANASPTFRQLADDSLRYDEPISQVTDLLAPTEEGGPWRIVGSVLDPGTGRSEAAVWSATSAPDWQLDEIEGRDADTSEAMAAIAPFGDELLAVGRVGDGEDGDAALWEANGDSWRRVVPPEMGGRHKQWAFDLKVGESGLLVAGGESAWGDIRPRMWFSTDGESWSSVDGGPGGPLDTSGEESVRAITAFGPGFVAVGTQDLDGEQDGAAWFSADGTTWEKVDASSLGGDGRQAVLSVANFNGTLLAGGYKVDGNGQGQPAVWSSTDGRTWSNAQLLPLLDDNRPAASDLAVRSLSVTGDRLIAAGGSDWRPHLWNSTDGATWSLLPEVARGDDLFADGVQLVDAVAGADNTVIGLGDTPTVLRLSGDRWVDATGDGFPTGGNRPQVTSVLLDDNALLAAGFNFTSAHGDRRERYTGRVWRRDSGGIDVIRPDDERPDLEAGKVNDMAPFAGGYVAVGFEDFSFADQRTAQPGANLPGGVLWTSEDGAAWTRQAAALQTPVAETLSALDGDAAALAAEATALAAEQPEVSLEPAGGRGTRSLEGVAALGNGYIAVGSVYGDNDADPNTPPDTDALVVVSADGTAITSADAALNGAGTQRFRDVCVSESGVALAVGMTGGDGSLDVAIRRRSGDGSWSEGTATDNSFSGRGSQDAFACAAGEDGFVVVGTDDSRGNVDARVWTSPDGVEWSEVTSGALGGAGDQEASAVAAVQGDGWLVAGTDSSSGDNDVALWRVRANGQVIRRDRGESSLNGPGDQVVESVTVDRDHAVVVGQDQTGIGIWETTNLDR
jgi:hypothetical protein